MKISNAVIVWVLIALLGCDGGGTDSNARREAFDHLDKALSQ